MPSMNNLFNPPPKKKLYVSVEIPSTMSPVVIEQSKFIVRDDDGETLAEGFVAIQSDQNTSSETLVIMSRDMAEELIAGYLDSNDITVEDFRTAIDMLSNEFKGGVMAERNRDEQRAARQRMRDTGENYTTAMRFVRQERADLQKRMQERQELYPVTQEVEEGE